MQDQIHPMRQVRELHDAATAMVVARNTMLRYELFVEGSSYDKQVRALISRLRKTADKIKVTDYDY